MQVISPEQMQKGFQNLVQAADDLQIDVPDAADLIATFVARAVVDDILPPAFVEKLASGNNTSAAQSKATFHTPVCSRFCARYLYVGCHNFVSELHL